MFAATVVPVNLSVAVDYEPISKAMSGRGGAAADSGDVDAGIGPQFIVSRQCQGCGAKADDQGTSPEIDDVREPPSDASVRMSGEPSVSKRPQLRATCTVSTRDTAREGHWRSR